MKSILTDPSRWEKATPRLRFAFASKRPIVAFQFPNIGCGALPRFGERET